MPSVTLAHGGCSVARAHSSVPIWHWQALAPPFPLIVSPSDRAKGGGRFGALQTPLGSNWTPWWNEGQYLIWPVLDRSCAQANSSLRAGIWGGFLAWAPGTLVQRMSRPIKADCP